MMQMKIVLISRALVLVLTVIASTPLIAAETYSFDKGHTEIRLSWDHVGMSTQFARFMEFDGAIVIDEASPDKSTVNVSFKTRSIKSTIAAFDKVLISDKFFDVAKYPKATFKSTSVRQIDKNTAEITGDLTIKGIRKTVKLKAELLFMGFHPLGPYIAKYKQAKYAGFRATGQLVRSEFGLGAFAPLVSDNIRIEINTELARQ